MKNGIIFLEPKKKLLNIFYASSMSALLAFSVIKSVSAHDGSECDGVGPFGVPGLDLPPEEIGEWGDVLPFPAQATHSVVMSSGKVLFWRDALPPYLFDPTTDIFSATQSPPFLDANVDFFCAGQATMADGRVMVVGGTQDVTNRLGISDVYMFSPVTETWEMAAPMAQSRWYPTLTTLLDGRMLVTSGTMTPEPNNIAIFPEIYDPQINAWTTLSSAGRNQPTYPFMYAMPNGSALDAGPGGVWSLDVNSPDPLWTFINTTFPYGVSGGSQSSAMYRPNHILKIGNRDEVTLELDLAFVLDMTADVPAWRKTSEMNYPRRRADAVLLPDGKVMISGGAVATQNDHECAVHAAEIWDPDTELFTEVASTTLSRIYHSTSVLLPDGRILAGGGEGSFGIGGRNTAELYSPPYLFKGPRPRIDSMPTVANYGTTFQVMTPDAATIETISLLRPAAITHNFDQNQRYLSLSFTAETDQVTVTAPVAENTPPGDYMLFLVNSSGAVSVAKFIRLEPTDIDVDGVFDHQDNCTLVANGPLKLDSGGNSQLDTDNDGYGNLCDGDLNNDNIVNVLDLGLLKARFFTADEDADLNGDGIVNAADLAILKTLFFMPPGPSGVVP